MSPPKISGIMPTRSLYLSVNMVSERPPSLALYPSYLHSHPEIIHHILNFRSRLQILPILHSYSTVVRTHVNGEQLRV